MFLLSRFIKKNKKDDLVEKKAADNQKQNFAQGYTGIVSSKKGHHGMKNGHATILIDGIVVGSSSPFKSKPKERLHEKIRQMVLLLDAQNALKVGDTDAFNQIKQRVIHEKLLSENEEFQALVADACSKAAKETGKDYRDPEYRKAFASVMVQAESMPLNINAKIAKIKDKKDSAKSEFEQKETTQGPVSMLNKGNDTYSR